MGQPFELKKCFTNILLLNRGGNQERPILERHCSMLSQPVTFSIWTFKWRKSIAAGDHLNMDIKMEEGNFTLCMCLCNIITMSFV